MDKRVLLVEDDEHKKFQILNFIQTNWADMSVESASSFQTGLRKLNDSDFSFVILDMTLPTFEVGPEEDGGELRQLGGQEFLRRMKRAQKLIPTVIVTQYETFGSGRDRVDLAGLRDILKSKYGSFCEGVIYYNSALDSWKQELRDLIDTAHNDEDKA